jgi:hypothetical protein
VIDDGVQSPGNDIDITKAALVSMMLAGGF